MKLALKTSSADAAFQNELPVESEDAIFGRTDPERPMPADHDMTSTELDRFRQRLSDWYKKHARDLPWRNSRNPYEVWVSEIMLQQTRVDQARPYFDRFIKRFPDVGTLASAELDDVLKLWEGLGYYSRARNLHRAAQQIVERFDGAFPADARSAQSLPGVGPYTAAAVLSIAYALPIPAVDGNVDRVISRYLALSTPVDRGEGRRTIRIAAHSLVDQVDPGSFNQAMMDLGATICTPAAPRCGECPIAERCRALALDSATDFPVTTKKGPVPHYDVSVGIIANDMGDLLLTRRPDDGMLGGLWEFPGARCRDGESLEAACRRGIASRIGLVVEPAEEVLSVKHAYSHFKITMHALSCRVDQRGFVEESAQPYRWINPIDMNSVALHTAARKIADHLASEQNVPKRRSEPV